jgi:hypothetical protein
MVMLITIADDVVIYGENHCRTAFIVMSPAIPSGSATLEPVPSELIFGHDDDLRASPCSRKDG